MIVFKCDYEHCPKEQERVNTNFIRVKHSGLDSLFCTVDHFSWWFTKTFNLVPATALRIDIHSNLFEAQVAPEIDTPDFAGQPVDPECCSEIEHCDTCTCERT